MAVKDMASWETGISQVISDGAEEEVILRGHKLSELIGGASFAQVMFLLLKGTMPTAAEGRVLDALLVASIDHSIAPPSMISRCFASYGASLPAAVAAGVLSFGDHMGGAGEELARELASRLDGRDDPDHATLGAFAREIVAEAAAAGKRVSGFGIPLHGADPRAPKLLAVARAEGVHGRHCRLAERIEEALAERAGRAIPMNLDGAGAALALDLGFSWRAVRLFIITPRTVSMAAHYLEEQAQGTRWRHLPTDAIAYRPDEG